MAELARPICKYCEAPLSAHQTVQGFEFCCLEHEDAHYVLKRLGVEPKRRRREDESVPTESEPSMRDGPSDSRWACAHCGRPLPLVSRLKRIKFCTPEHEIEYEKRQAERVLERIKGFVRPGKPHSIASTKVLLRKRPDSLKSGFATESRVAPEQEWAPVSIRCCLPDETGIRVIPKQQSPGLEALEHPQARANVVVPSGEGKWLVANARLTLPLCTMEPFRLSPVRTAFGFGMRQQHAGHVIKAPVWGVEQVQPVLAQVAKSTVQRGMEFAGVAWRRTAVHPALGGVPRSAEWRGPESATAVLAPVWQERIRRDEAAWRANDAHPVTATNHETADQLKLNPIGAGGGSLPVPALVTRTSGSADWRAVGQTMEIAANPSNRRPGSILTAHCFEGARHASGFHHDAYPPAWRESGQEPVLSEWDGTQKPLRLYLNEPAPLNAVHASLANHAYGQHWHLHEEGVCWRFQTGTPQRQTGAPTGVLPKVIHLSSLAGLTYRTSISAWLEQDCGITSVALDCAGRRIGWEHTLPPEARRHSPVNTTPRRPQMPERLRLPMMGDFLPTCSWSLRSPNTAAAGPVARLPDPVDFSELRIL